MQTLSANETLLKIEGLLQQVNQTHEAILLTHDKGNGVLISEADWQIIQETLYLQSIPV